MTSVHLVSNASGFRSSTGVLWKSDAKYAIGGSYSSTTQTIADTPDQGLYQQERYGQSGYHVPLANGTYRVTLYLAEHYWTQPGQRVFGVSAEGRTAVSRIDIVRAVGEFHAYQVRFTVAVADGALDLGFTDYADLPSVTGLGVVPAAVATPGTTAYVTPEAFGAAGDGVTDDTAALQQAFDNANGKPVLLAAGRSYAHSGVLHLRTAGLHVTGGGILLATAEATSSVWIEADNVTVDGIVVRTKSTTQRWSDWEQMGVRLDGHQGITLRNITVDGSAAAGIYVGGQTKNFLLDHVTVENTRADGIHMTEGANNGKVIDPLVQNSGDDGVAVVSYGSDGEPCHDITVTSPTVLGTSWGRGLSVVGGTRIAETGIDVENTSAAGVYIAAEGDPWYTAAPSDVSVSGGRIVGANTDASVDHGAVLVLSGESNVTPDDVSVSGLTITGTRSSASRDFGVITYGTAPQDVQFSNLAISGGPGDAYQGNTPQSSYTTRDITQNGTTLPDQG